MGLERRESEDKEGDGRTGIKAVCQVGVFFSISTSKDPDLLSNSDGCVSSGTREDVIELLTKKSDESRGSSPDRRRQFSLDA
jgi:hypothetical protein